MSNQSNVGREGQEGVRPGRGATTGVHVGASSSNAETAVRVRDPWAPRGQGNGRGPRAIASSAGAATASYYGLPVLNEPVWSARDIAGYLFLGGLAGASAAVGAGAHVTGRRALARGAKLGAAGAVGLSLAALVHDLGRPTRFLNMLRVLKVTSPMNIGSWLLAGFAPAAMASAASEVTGLAPTGGAIATAAAAVLGPGVSAYTAALIANTAVPSWHGGHRTMPYVFVASGASAAAGWGLLTAPPTECEPVRRLALVAGPAEIALTKLMEREMGMAAEPYHQGRAGIYMKLAVGLTALGSLTSSLARRDRRAGIAAGAALLLGSAFERFGVFRAGVQSARDPVYTIAPQRARRAEVTARG